MGRTQERGKAVKELTLDELQREQSRCQAMLRAFGDKPMAKELRKRLIQIDSRLASFEKSN